MNCRNAAWIVAVTWLVARAVAPGAQQPDRRFEFVSLRRVPPTCVAPYELSTRCEREPRPATMWRMFPGGRLELTNQLGFDLVRVAYSLEALDATYLSGGPGWLRGERYDV